MGDAVNDDGIGAHGIHTDAADGDILGRHPRVLRLHVDALDECWRKGVFTPDQNADLFHND
jgi:hypothetical protein